MHQAFLITQFLSSFLLFLVQPMIAKAMLPMVGGAPAVWIVVMLCFQVLLLGGYAYAAVTSKYLGSRQQATLQAILIFIALSASVPLHINGAFQTTDVPELWVIRTLLISVGFPFLVLSANTTLLQRWYQERFDAPPYHFFSVSNAGSLLGLIAYPFLVERIFSLPEQMMLWSIGFCLVVLLIGGIAWSGQSRGPAARPATPSKSLPLPVVCKILFASFVPSSLFLGLTLFITTDIAALPLIWIIPFAIYLLSFVLVYSRDGEEWAARAQKLHPYTLLLFFALMMYVSTQTIPLHFLCYFIIALSCHGELMRMRPTSESLPAYYFWLAMGGALGGLFNVIAPYLFTSVLEYPLVLFLSIFALPGKVKASSTPAYSRLQTVLIGSLIIGMAVAVQFLGESQTAGQPVVLYKERNFFGISSVERYDNEVIFKHGSTLHGVQALKEEDRLKTTSYYLPIKDLLATMPASFFDNPFGVLGLGAGTAACYGHSNQPIDFFEINPSAVYIASNPGFFSYLRDCQTKISIFKGDGRLELARRPEEYYQLLVMDAFTSDAIPLHLISKEAIGEYIRKVKPTSGIIAFNISNRHFRLENFIAKAAAQYKWVSYYRFFKDPPKDSLVYQSQWLLIVPPDSPWEKNIKSVGFTEISAPGDTPLWTDNFSNIIPAIKW